MKNLSRGIYQTLLSRMDSGTYPNGDKWWRLDLTGLCNDLPLIRVDFIGSPWNAAQRFWGYLNDFNLVERINEICH